MRPILVQYVASITWYHVELKQTIQEIALPKNTSILLIRHAEKPTDHTDPTLAPTGQARALAYVAYFRHYQLAAQPLMLHYLFASALSKDSQRPQLTLLPLAAALGLAIDSTISDNDYPTLASNILNNPIYDNHNLLICWHHGAILNLALALGAQPDTLPKTWPADQYGWLVLIQYGADGKLSQSSTISQHLMYGDDPKYPPADVNPGAATALAE